MAIKILDGRETEALEFLVIYEYLTSYKLAKISDIPVSTVWRILLKLKSLSLVAKQERGFTITPRGLVFVYYLTKKESIRLHALQRLKEAWKYDGSIDEIKSFLSALNEFLKKYEISLISICFNHPISVVSLMLPRANELDEPSKRVLARFILKTFPTITLPNGCKAIISFDENEEPYALAADCKVQGVRIFHKCPYISRQFSLEAKPR
ncbi:hypothetical protein DFR86_00305 [Acidianus sulfidivorans JP7]|uniref:Uncharacterized protein n=1 Tax=Acidianus sulfidivorans JP7 TaxID=619593 RepID=A0A2U9IJA4_9CREN|nr:hypothetical protein [Acidianus sulfidivorans]AWR96138.1 hypothetical protein DFR86_00305 [Acidianus sulfidivorans JP7]